MGLGTLAGVARHQHGLFTRAQARAAGIDRNGLLRFEGVGVFERQTARVFRFAGSAPGPYTLVLAAVLDAGKRAVASHLTAASLWGVPNLRSSPIHVAIPRTDQVRRRPVARLHQATCLPADLLTVLHDVPVVVPALAVLQVAAIAPRRAAHVADTIWAKRVLRIGELQTVHDRYQRQGQVGIKVVRSLLEHRSDDMRPAESGNERRFEWIMADGGVDTLRRQVDLGGAAWIGRVDYADTVVPLVVEVHSDRYHSSMTTRQADAARIAGLQQAGFTVVVVWDHEIWGDPDVVLERVKITRAGLLVTAA